MAKTSHAIKWQAHEHIEQKHNFWWFLGLFLICIGFSVIAILLKWWTFLILIILSTISIFISALRPPRIVNYALDNTGLTENTKLHPYNEYRAFGILQEGAHYSAVLIPKKRFSISTKIYFPETSGEAIVDALGNHLPMEEVKLDILDKLVNFLRI